MWVSEVMGCRPSPTQLSGPVARINPSTYHTKDNFKPLASFFFGGGKNHREVAPTGTEGLVPNRLTYLQVVIHHGAGLCPLPYSLSN